jgi:hypothetical protein
MILMLKCSDIYSAAFIKSHEQLEAKEYIQIQVSRNTFLNLWKEAAIGRVFSKGRTYCDGKYRPIAIFNNFSKVSQLIIYNHVLHFQILN